VKGADLVVATFSPALAHADQTPANLQFQG
jgi:hypothetical protein